MSQKIYDLIQNKIDRLAEVCALMVYDKDVELHIELIQILEDLNGYEFFIKKHEELKDEIDYIKARFLEGYKNNNAKTF